MYRLLSSAESLTRFSYRMQGRQCLLSLATSRSHSAQYFLLLIQYVPVSPVIFCSLLSFVPCFEVGTWCVFKKAGSAFVCAFFPAYLLDLSVAFVIGSFAFSEGGWRSVYFCFAVSLFHFLLPACFFMNTM